MSISQKILYKGWLTGNVPVLGTEKKELRSLLQFEINEGKGLPSFFPTGNCAEHHFKPPWRLLEMYTAGTSRSIADVDLSNHNTLFAVLQKNTHIVSSYFDLRAFNISAYWYRQEFIKNSKSMIRKYHNHKLQTTPWHREEKLLNHHETPGRQIKQSNQFSLPHQDDCNTRMDVK